MYDPIFSKSFNRYERKRFGFCALILCFIIALSFSSSFKPRLHPLSIVGNAVNLQLSINAEEDMLMTDIDMNHNSNQTVESSTNLQMSTESAAKNVVVLNETTPASCPILAPSRNETIKKVSIESVCKVLEANADYCDIEGEIRVDSNSYTIFLITKSRISTNTTSLIIQPYPRKGIPYVKNWTLTLASNNDENAPKCSENHSVPAVLFSLGGFSGNHFHDFADLIVPLYATSSRFRRDVHFLATDYKPWWPSKYRVLLNKLTKHALVDIDREKGVHCYKKMIFGLQFDKELIINQSSSFVSMSKFRQLLRETYSLKRKEALKNNKGQTRPRLVIISRKRTRMITNEGQVCKMARKMGYEVVLAEGDTRTNLTGFAQLVNSCDVMMGVHGAGLTNMVFLPDNAILIQIVPLGGIDVFAKLDFGNPAEGMRIRYLEHKIGIKESSLIRQYGIHDPVIRDPMSVHRKGWDSIRRVYLDNQNVTVDVRRLRGTLAKAIKLLV